jgi:TonB family protein
VVTRTIPLVAPPEELTQKAPNRGKVSKEFDVASLAPRQATEAAPPSPPASVRSSAPQRLAPAPGRGAAEAVRPPVTMPEPPKVEVAQAPAPVVAPPVPQPRIEAEEKPKLAFESVRSQNYSGHGPGASKYAVPGRPVDELVRGATGGGRSSVNVGEQDETSLGTPGGAGAPGAPGHPGSALDLLSDPAGANFRPYLAQVLAQVRRNWMTIFPDAARMGQRGKVVAQFIIGQDGSLVKVVLAAEAANKSLNEAAVAALQMSAPFPAFPSGYRGGQVRLQLSFLYNMR